MRFILFRAAGNNPRLTEECCKGEAVQPSVREFPLLLRLSAIANRPSRCLLANHWLFAPRVILRKEPTSLKANQSPADQDSNVDVRVKDGQQPARRQEAEEFGDIGTALGYLG